MSGRGKRVTKLAAAATKQPKKRSTANAKPSRAVKAPQTATAKGANKAKESKGASEKKPFSPVGSYAVKCTTVAEEWGDQAGGMDLHIWETSPGMYDATFNFGNLGRGHDDQPRHLGARAALRLDGY